MDLMINGVRFREAAESPKSPIQSYNPDGARTVRTFRCQGSSEEQRYAAAVALLGYSYLDTSVTPNCVRRVTPHAYPAVRHPLINPSGTPHLFCTEVGKCEPYGMPMGIDADDRAIYDWKVIEANYNNLPYLIRQDAEVLSADPLSPFVGKPDEGWALAQGWQYSRYITRTREYAPKTVTMRHGMPRYVEDNRDKRAGLPEGLAIVQYRIRVSYTWHNVPLPAIPHEAMEQLANHCNLGDFDEHPEGTLVYTGTKERPAVGGLGAWPRQVDLEHSFLYIPNVDAVSDAAGVPEYEVKGVNAVPRAMRREGSTDVKDRVIRWHNISIDGNPEHIDPTLTPYWNDYYVFKYGDFARLFRPDYYVPPAALRRKKPPRNRTGGTDTR